MITSSRICTLIWHWYSFPSHGFPCLTAWYYQLHWGTHRTAAIRDVLMTIYQLLWWREEQLLLTSALQWSRWNSCNIKFVFKEIEASEFGTVHISYLPNEYTFSSHLSLYRGWIDILLSRSIVCQPYITNYFSSLGILGLILVLIGFKGFQFCLTLQSPFNMTLVCTETLISYHLNYLVSAVWYSYRSLTSRNCVPRHNKDFLSPEHSHGKLIREPLSKWLSGCCQSCCQRAAVRWLLSEWLLPQGFLQSGYYQSQGNLRLSVRALLLEWLLSLLLPSERYCQRAAVKAAAVVVIVYS